MVMEILEAKADANKPKGYYEFEHVKNEEQRFGLAS